MSKDLYVKNIAAEVQEEELRKLFSLCGKVNYIHMVKDPQSGVFLGCAYVKMASEEEAKDARVTIDGTRLYNRDIVVEVALPQRTGRHAQPGVPPKGAPRPAPAGRVSTERPLRPRGTAGGGTGPEKSGGSAPGKGPQRPGGNKRGGRPAGGNRRSR